MGWMNIVHKCFRCLSHWGWHVVKAWDLGNPSVIPGLPLCSYVILGTCIYFWGQKGSLWSFLWSLANPGPQKSTKWFFHIAQSTGFEKISNIELKSQSSGGSYCNIKFYCTSKFNFAESSIWPLGFVMPLIYQKKEPLVLYFLPVYIQSTEGRLGSLHSFS